MSTLDDLRKIIREEVKTAVRTELRELILEAVEIASRPEQPLVTAQHVSHKQENSLHVDTKPVQKPLKTSNPIQDVLSETAQAMTSEDYENIYGTNVKDSLAESYRSSEGEIITDSISGDEDALDGLPSFVKNAKAILDASYNKDKERHAV